MKNFESYFLKKICILVILFVFPLGISYGQIDPLPSWNEGTTKNSIISFVNDVTNPAGSKYVDPKDRIATFDNDGTLWCEQPVIQAAYTFTKVKEMYPSHPEWKDEKIFSAVYNNDKEYIEEDINSGGKGLMQVLAAVYAGISLEQFQSEVNNFFSTETHPKFKQKYTEMYYVPMLELINYLKANEFNVFICSGGGIDFMRVISEDIYGIPTQNVIGSLGKSKFEIKDGKVQILKMPELLLLNDKEGKPVGIDYFIGKKPIFSAGNVRSGGDIAMSEYCQSNSLPSIQLIVNHDDQVREFEYSEKGNESLDAAAKNGWNVISMKSDWKKIFEFDK